MIIQNLYRYMGENGILDSLILLPNTPHILRHRLIAEKGYILQSIASHYTTHAIDVNSEKDIENWIEIPEGQE